MVDPITPEAAARLALDQIEWSGYGTNRPDRYTPTFDVEVVRVLAEAVLPGGNNPDQTTESG